MTLITAAVSAASQPAGNNVEPGLLGFLVVAVLGVVLVFLLRSMNKQFRKLGPKPEETDEAADAPAPPAEEPAKQG